VIRHLNDVASTNPQAWFGQKRHVDELTTSAVGNRMVATPYAKRTTAFLNVDMAAANLLVTKQVADAWNVPDDRRVYLRGWGFARDAVHVAARAHLDASPGMRAATTCALDRAGMDIDEIEAFDLYSCFGSAVQFATDVLRLSPQDPRPRSMTGGLPYHGGPSSNYVSHSVSHIVSQLREGTHQTALSTGIGMHMTKHVAAVWSRSPGVMAPAGDDGPQQWDHPGGQDDRRVVDSFDGPGVLVAATVVHDTEGQPDHVIAICERADGARCYARSTEDAVLTAVLEDRWANQPARIDRPPVRPTPSGSNEGPKRQQLCSARSPPSKSKVRHPAHGPAAADRRHAPIAPAPVSVACHGQCCPGSWSVSPPSGIHRPESRHSTAAWKPSSEARCWNQRPSGEWRVMPSKTVARIWVPWRPMLS